MAAKVTTQANSAAIFDQCPLLLSRAEDLAKLRSWRLGFSILRDDDDFPGGHNTPLSRHGPRSDLGAQSNGSSAAGIARSESRLAFLLLALALGAAGIGWFQKKRWGWRLAVCIMLIQLLGDLLNLVRGDYLRGVTGVAIARALFVYVCRPPVKALFN